MKIARLGLLLAALVIVPTQANATSGSGCYVVVNVPSWDVLNIRSRPTSSSKIVGTIDSRGGPIIAGGRSAAEAKSKCVPKHRSLSSRWCPINVYTGDVTISGWVKRRYLRQNDCP